MPVGVFGNFYAPGTSPFELNGGGVSVVPSNSAFAALAEDGSVNTWGDPSFAASRIWGKAFEATREGVTAIFTTGTAYAALKRDGSVWCWGNPSAGGEPAIVRPNHALESYEWGLRGRKRRWLRRLLGRCGVRRRFL
jgi:hypothetical protein